MTRGQTNNVEVVIPATTSNIANIEEYWSTLKSSTKRNQQPPDNTTAHSRAPSPNDYINIQLDEVWMTQEKTEKDVSLQEKRKQWRIWTLNYLFRIERIICFKFYFVIYVKAGIIHVTMGPKDSTRCELLSDNCCRVTSAKKIPLQSLFAKSD